MGTERPHRRPSAHRERRSLVRGASPPAPAAAALRYLAHVVPGLEEVAADEIAAALSTAKPANTWRQFDERTSLLEFSYDGSPRPWLALRTVEDVFVVAARGRSLRSDQAGLGQLAAATLAAKPFDAALRAFAACHPAPARTFRVVARKSGNHAFRRVDAQRAVAGAIGTRLPHLRLVEEEADIEFWLTLIGDVGLVGLRLSGPKMRQSSSHGFASVPASLKPTVARAMVRLSGPRADDVVLDPFCGAGTLLIERALAADFAALHGGDRDPGAVGKARANAKAAAVPMEIELWDTLSLPLPDASVDVVLTNPPFGKKVKIGGDPDAFYARLIAQLRRVLRPGGRLVLITSQVEAFRRSIQALPDPFLVQKRVPVLVRGERAAIFVAEVPAKKAGDRRGAA